MHSQRERKKIENIYKENRNDILELKKKEYFRIHNSFTATL